MHVISINNTEITILIDNYKCVPSKKKKNVFLSVKTIITVNIYINIVLIVIGLYDDDVFKSKKKKKRRSNLT